MTSNIDHQEIKLTNISLQHFKNRSHDSAIMDFPYTWDGNRPWNIIRENICIVLHRQMNTGVNDIRYVIALCHIHAISVMWAILAAISLSCLYIRIGQHCFNSLRPSYVYMRQWSNHHRFQWRQAIIETNAGILLIRILGTNFSLIESETRTFYSRKCIWKCRLRNGGHLFLASTC